MPQLTTWMMSTDEDGQEIRLQYDKSNNLYINNRKIVTEEVIKLRGLELIILLLTMVGVCASAVMAVLSFIYH